VQQGPPPVFSGFDHHQHSWAPNTPSCVLSVTLYGHAHSVPRSYTIYKRRNCNESTLSSRAHQTKAVFELPRGKFTEWKAPHWIFGHVELALQYRDMRSALALLWTSI
jgi:hypothetical protein